MRASCSVPRDLIGRDGAIRFYFDDGHANELLLFSLTAANPKYSWSRRDLRPFRLKHVTCHVSLAYPLSVKSGQPQS